MRQYKKLSIVSAVTFLALAGLALFGGDSALAATCYTEGSAPLTVEPETFTCPPPSTPPDRSVVYVDSSGNDVPNPTSGSNCFVQRPPISGVPHSGYRLESCANLNILLNNARQSNCERSGGAWHPAVVVSDVLRDASCECPVGVTLDASFRCSGSADDDPPGRGNPGDPLTVDDADGQKILDWINAGLNLLAGLAGIAITASVIVAGIQYSTSGGNPQGAAAAKKRIGQALVALLAFTFLYTFLQWLVPGGIFQ